MPVKSNAEGVARYVGKYISKHIRQRVADDKGARLVRYIGYKPDDRTASCRFSWNSENAWLWRHKVAAYAKRHGVTGLDGMRRKFGRRWAYRRCREILAEPLRDIVFPSEAAAMKSFNEEWKVVVARDKADRIIENLPLNRTVLIGNETINDYWPILDVAVSPDLPSVGHAKEGEEVASTAWSPEIRREFEKSAREMRLYAARLKVLNGCNWARWE
jgi:hypothetical protein